ncbi:MAG: hypothetical protein AMJ90_10035 [candidate division Zixibacteria bacterium SM23_73_2]|nr:MAG: hypothetical protein AMJ90_10035 [candidate division Zixibacteria bacterium SM23_73_2]
MLKRIIFIGIGVVVLIVVIFSVFKGSSSKSNQLTMVKVERGQIVDKALAIGTLVPKNEIAVKSKISGIVKKVFVEIGDKVKKGDPLIDISPSPTPLEFAEAKRNVGMVEVAFQNSQKEYQRAKTLLEKNLISEEDFDQKKKSFDEAKLRLQLGQEKLSLIEEGKIQIAEKKIESVIKSPITGTVLERKVNEGDPVVPLTSYQEGTELMTMAYMDDLVFKGTVDEIDVGKLNEGMNAEIKVGAIPNDTVEGVLYKISPKAKKEENATLFDVELKITRRGERMLRAGYSANADIIINKKEDILLIPERLVEFKEDSVFVEIKGTNGEVTKKPIKTGLSDGMNIEVTEGLEEGDQIVQRPPKEIK